MAAKDQDLILEDINKRLQDNQTDIDLAEVIPRFSENVIGLSRQIETVAKDLSEKIDGVAGGAKSRHSTILKVLGRSSPAAVMVTLAVLIIPLVLVAASSFASYIDNTTVEAARETPPRIPRIWSWRKCHPPDSYWTPSQTCPNPNGWSPEDVVHLMNAFPAHSFRIPDWTRTPGNIMYTHMGDYVDQAQDYAATIGADVSNFIIGIRIDVFAKSIEGYEDCDPNCGWAGDMDGSKGDMPFDTDWIMRVPTELHNQVVDDIWGGRDPFNEDLSWPRWFDRYAVQALNTRDEKIALYGGGSNRGAPLGDEIFRVRKVVMDLRIPEYRDWSIKYLFYRLEDGGIDPGESFRLSVSPKPGWHTYYDGPDSGHACYIGPLTDGTPVNAWAGIAQPVCSNGRAPGGPFHPTQYGPGEFEAALNAWILEAITALEVAGYDDFEIVTCERPNYLGQHWSTLTPEVQSNPHLIGECGVAITPDASLYGPPLRIDIKPGSDPNPINPFSRGVIPVAILTTEAFDALTVDGGTVGFGPYDAEKKHKQAHVEDVDGDGDLDLLLHFPTPDTGMALGDTEACLIGETYDGMPLEGCDSVTTVFLPFFAPEPSALWQLGSGIGLLTLLAGRRRRRTAWR
jgi:hypothetical protein